MSFKYCGVLNANSISIFLTIFYSKLFSLNYILNEFLIEGKLSFIINCREAYRSTIFFLHTLSNLNVQGLGIIYKFYFFNWLISNIIDLSLDKYFKFLLSISYDSEELKIRFLFRNLKSNGVSRRIQ